MKIEYYAFASFLTGLICLIAIICKVLFANMKQQYKLLDEKETKLLQLYQAVESIMEEFSDQVKVTTEEIIEYGAKQKPALLVTKKESEPVFQQVLEEAVTQPPPICAETPKKQTRNETILALAEEGKTDAQIASELGITQNEVRLIYSLTRN